MISYAQAREDVYLWRALAPRVPHGNGFWIDVGGFDPEADSVTKVFSDHGWHGINVEPLEANYQRFVEQRPRDINIRAAVTDRSGDVMFHDIVGQQLGTLVGKFADRHAEAGFERRTITVPGMTLTEICERHAPDTIHFLKIDVEGHEDGVIRGMDFTRFRPWLLVIEATEPNNLLVPTHHDWDHLVLAGGYGLAYADHLNRYYVANEHPDLVDAFAVPVDDYALATHLNRIAELEAELEAFRAGIPGIGVSAQAPSATAGHGA